MDISQTRHRGIRFFAFGLMIIGLGFMARAATPHVAAASGQTIESSAGSIASFAADWWWSKQYGQDGKYGETKVIFSITPSSVSSANLTVRGSYSQSSGSATIKIYIRDAQQVTPTDADHNKGNYWYGNTANGGTLVGTMLVASTGSEQSFSVTSYVSAHPSATYYIAVENTATADVGVSSVKMTVTKTASLCGNDRLDRGENCQKCPTDCACAANQCCVLSSSNASTVGCVKSGKATTKGRLCCSGKNVAGNCCTDNQCGSSQQCVSYRCTDFLTVFYKRYYQSRMTYDGGTVKPSDAYQGLATLYREQATKIDVPIITLGKFATTLDTLSDSTRSLLTLNFLGLAVNSYRFFDEMEDWQLPQPAPLQDTLLNVYSAGSLLADAASEGSKLDKPLTTLASHLPSNSYLKNIIKRHKAMQAKILTAGEMKLMFYADVADFAMDATLLSAVDSRLDTDVLDYVQKLQLAIVANDLSKLYRQAEKRTLSEKEALGLMALEREFWVGVISRSTTRLADLERQGGSAEQIADLTDVKQTAEGKLSDIDGRRKLTTTVYFGKDIFSTSRKSRK